jgi:hypothetical protein
MKKSPVFEETYNKYLSHISDIDLLPRAARLGAELAGDALIISYYEKPFRISIDGVFDETGKRASFATSVVLFRYVFSCPAEIPIAGDWVTYITTKLLKPHLREIRRRFNTPAKDWEDGCLMMIHPGIFRWHSICCPEYRSVFDLTIKTMSSRLSAPSCSGNLPNPISIWKVWP